MAFKVVYRVLRKISDWALWAFYSEVYVEGQDNVPLSGPTIFHHNELIDIASLAAKVRDRRMISYWTKSSAFSNPIASAILFSSGSIPVDRKSKDNQGLFRGTFDSISAGDVVGIFPEGTSYTEPRIIQVKDGVAWAALEYMKWTKSLGPGVSEIVVVPVGIVYTDKSMYRSRVHVEFGKPIAVTRYIQQFLSSGEGESRSSAKRLCHEIAQSMIRLTVNAPDWDTLYAARMARDILWTDEKNIPLKSFVQVSQTLTDIFADPEPSPALEDFKSNLLRYHSLLHYSRLTHTSLSPLPIPVPPTVLRLTLTLLRLSLSIALRLPTFIVPLTVHVPSYVLGALGARLARDEEEARAQLKVVFGGLGRAIVYPLFGWKVWKMLKVYGVVRGFVRRGGLARDIAATAGLAWLVSRWHEGLIDINYTLFKQYRASWKVFIGLLFPSSSDVPTAALAPYLTPPPPPTNPFISKALDSNPIPTRTAKSTPTRVASRRLIRHVLRARADAARSSAAFFAELDAPDVFVGTSAPYGLTREEAGEGVVADGKPVGRRSGSAVVALLRKNGAAFGSLAATG